MTLVDFGNVVLQMPDFLHDFSSDVHRYKGSLARHVAVERVLYKVQSWLTAHDAMPGHFLLSAALGLVFGLNCGFPAKHVALYVAWYLKGCKAVAVFPKINNKVSIVFKDASVNGDVVNRVKCSV